MQFKFLDGDPTQESMDLYSKAELAIIDHAKVGVDDRGRVAFMFSVNAKGYSSSMWMRLDEDTEKFIKYYEVSDVKKLNGLPCLVYSTDNMVQYVLPWSV